jgi:hypothetical protein
MHQLRVLGENLIFCTIRNFIHALKKEPLNIMHLHTSRRMDGPWIKTVPVVSHIFDVSSSTGLGIEGCRTCWKDEYGNHTLGTKSSKYAPTKSFWGQITSPVLLATSSYALALGWDTKPGHHGLVHPDSWRENLIFWQTVVSYTLLSRNHWT